MQRQKFRTHLALVNVDLAVPPSESGGADAGVVVDAVHARRGVQTRVRLALVNIHLAVGA